MIHASEHILLAIDPMLVMGVGSSTYGVSSFSRFQEWRFVDLDPEGIGDASNKS
jgi:hypothetical protein